MQEKHANIFSLRLRNLIAERGTTITALSKELKISRQAVSQYADGTGQPNVEKLRAIACYFGVSTDYLVGLSDYTNLRTADLSANSMGIREITAEILSDDKENGSGLYGEVVSTLVSSSCFYDFAVGVMEYIRDNYDFENWNPSNIDSISVKKELNKFHRFSLIELFLNVLDDVAPPPDFSEKERIARERVRKENAINPQDDK